MLGTYKKLDSAKRIVIDIETKDPFLKTKGASWAHGEGYILGISIKIDEEPAEYYPLRHQNETNYDRLHVSRYLSDISYNSCIVGHYSYYDLGWLNHEMGWYHKNGKFRDTLITSQLHNNSLFSHSLDSMCKYFGIGAKSEIGDPSRIWTLPISTVASYANHDVDLTAALDNKLSEFWDTEACIRECQLVPILVLMKAKGIDIDEERLDEIQKYLMEEYKNTASQIECRDIWANASVAAYFRRLGVPYFSTDKGTPSFPNWYLESISHPNIQLLAKARKLHKLINTFCVGIRQSRCEDGRIRPDFFNGRSDDGGTLTGRFSAAHPNVQQIPHRSTEGNLIRSTFIPDNQIWYKFDYKQQEPIFMLHYASKLDLSGIEEWKERYKSSNADFYRPLQEAMGIDRQFSKTLSLACSYNMGPELMSQRSHITFEEAVNYIRLFHKTLPWMSELKGYCSNRAINAGKIRTIGDRYLYFDRHNASLSLNHLVQGSGADQIKAAMLRIYKEMDLVPILQVHDNLDYDFTEEMFMQEKDEQIEEIMKDVFHLDFPVRVDKQMGHNWQEAG